MRYMTSFVLVLVLSTASYAQTRTERVADLASYGTVATALVLDTKAAWDAPDRRHALSMLGSRAFVTWAWAEIAKGLVQRQRPDGSDNKSFYSMHTAFAFSTLGGPRARWSVSLGVGTGAGRVVGKKHYLTDVLVGAGVGALTSRIR